MKICLINDTSKYHSGCKAVINFYNIYCKRKKYKIIKSIYSKELIDIKTLKECNLVIVNGEGTMHHDTVSKTSIDNNIDLALEYNIPIKLVNTVWQDIEYNDRYKNLDQVIVREIDSYNAFIDCCGFKPDICLDLSYFGPIKNCDFKDFNNKIVVGDFFHANLVNLNRFSKYDRLNIFENEWDFIVNSLKTAKLYITGRHHGVYAACKARIPFVVHKSNTHKVSGLFKWAGVDIPIAENTDDIFDNINWAKKNLDVYEKLFKFMDNCKFINFL